MYEYFNRQYKKYEVADNLRIAANVGQCLAAGAFVITVAVWVNGRQIDWAYLAGLAAIAVAVLGLVARYFDVRRIALLVAARSEYWRIQQSLAVPEERPLNPRDDR
jgi:hypothetical protein